MSVFSGLTSLGKWLLFCQQLPITLQPGVGFLRPCWSSAKWISERSSLCSQSCCDIAVVPRKPCLTADMPTASGSYSLPVPSPMMIPEPWEEKCGVDAPFTTGLSSLWFSAWWPGMVFVLIIILLQKKVPVMRGNNAITYGSKGKNSGCSLSLCLLIN